MRLRFGVPCAMPLDQWRCNCSAHAGPRHSAFVERVNEPNDVDIAGTFAAEPLHGLYCKRRWMRVMKRHDYIRDALCRALDRITGVRTTREPRVENPQGGGDQRRGDIRVHKDGTTWVVDIGVVCPGTAQYVGKGAATVPGKAASVYEDVKVAKYIDQSNFVPFIVETGGRVGVAGRRFLDTLVGGLVSDEGAAPDNCRQRRRDSHGEVGRRQAGPGAQAGGPASRRVGSGQATGLHAGANRGRDQRAGPRG